MKAFTVAVAATMVIGTLPALADAHVFFCTQGTFTRANAPFHYHEWFLDCKSAGGKNYCEPQGEWNTHVYLPATTGVGGGSVPAAVGYGGGRLVLGPPQDGNLAGDCIEGYDFEPGVVCVGVDPADPVDTFFAGLCDARPNLPLGDWDGHLDMARGGAWIHVWSGDGSRSEDPNVGAGSFYCYGVEGHHNAYGPFQVADLVGGSGVTVIVAVDAVDEVALPGAGFGCGDWIIDNATQYDGTSQCDCKVTFPPGLDGTYQVFITGTTGTLLW